VRAYANTWLFMGVASLTWDILEN